MPCAYLSRGEVRYGHLERVIAERRRRVAGRRTENEFHESSRMGQSNRGLPRPAPW